MDKLNPFSARPIREWNEDDRPREKLLLKGRAVLSEAELLAILLGSGTHGESAVDVARGLLSKAGNSLDKLGKMNTEELQNIPGIGPAKAVRISAAFELGRRRTEAGQTRRPQITGSKSAYDVFRPHFEDLGHEEFWVMVLNRNNRIIGSQKVGMGGIDRTVADVRIILKFAIMQSGSGIIVAHNHPSGNLTPSESDIKLTQQIAHAGRFMEIQLLDHLIVSDAGYFSFADEGKL